LKSIRNIGWHKRIQLAEKTSKRQRQEYRSVLRFGINLLFFVNPFRRIETVQKHMISGTLSQVEGDATVKTTQHRRNLTMLLTIALVVYWLSAFLGTHVPLRIHTDLLPHNTDKVLHVIGYAILAALLLGRRASRGPFGRRSTLVRWVLLMAYGAFDELSQQLVGRQVEFADWLADQAGVLCGLGFVILLVRTLGSRTMPHITGPHVEELA
jgi:VanZ family protein